MLSPQQQCEGALKSVKPTEKSNCFVDILLCADFLSLKQSEFTRVFVQLSGSSLEHPSQPASGNGQCVCICSQLSAGFPLLFYQLGVFCTWDKTNLMLLRMHLFSDWDFRSMHSERAFMYRFVTKTPFQLLTLCLDFSPCQWNYSCLPTCMSRWDKDCFPLPGHLWWNDNCV